MNKSISQGWKECKFPSNESNGNLRLIKKMNKSGDT